MWPSGLRPAFVCKTIDIHWCMVQWFHNWDGGGGTLAQRAQGFVNGRSPPAHMQLSIAEHSLTAGDLFHAQPLQDNTRLLLRASCSLRQCYHVVNYDTVKRGLRGLRDPLLCPAHDVARHTYSDCVLYFYNVLQQIGYQGVVVWDWNDVPQRRHMHWDATLFTADFPHRIEIDGPVHDLRAGLRLPGDICKDARVLGTAGVSLLRLKHQDCATWAVSLQTYMHGRLQFQIHDVWGTVWYLPFQYPGHGPMLGYLQII